MNKEPKLSIPDSVKKLKEPNRYSNQIGPEMRIYIKKLNELATIPEYQTDGAACFDITSCEKVRWYQIQDSIGNTIGFETIISTGLAFQVPKEYALKVYPRSGWGFKHNIQLANGTGILDSDYKGELKIKLISFGIDKELPEINVGARIAQAAIEWLPISRLIEVDELSDTERGSNGFGSTGH